MLNRRTLVSALPLLSLAPLLQAAPGAKAGDDSKLADLMGELNAGMRKLKGANPDRSTLEVICKLQHLALDAKNEDPPMLGAEGDEKKQAAARLDYRKTMQALVNQLFAAENAALSGDKDALAAALREMNNLKGDGHKKYKPKN
jgi:soluble cytochrome b562